eukprot:TRINITY_DN22143_c0_g1_i1.p2 TRINITY_DN22143_c0_g1~~TRINITY_DN22143_c0_g1_i1.p2  ORF type:complete len:345 (-),score=82.11 TRINITY_DN22143_c0_g1_i1:1204-2238(-)
MTQRRPNFYERSYNKYHDPIERYSNHPEHLDYDTVESEYENPGREFTSQYNGGRRPSGYGGYSTGNFGARTYDEPRRNFSTYTITERSAHPATDRDHIERQDYSRDREYSRYHEDRDIHDNHGRYYSEYSSAPRTRVIPPPIPPRPKNYRPSRSAIPPPVPPPPRNYTLYTESGREINYRDYIDNSNSRERERERRERDYYHNRSHESSYNSGYNQGGSSVDGWHSKPYRTGSNSTSNYGADWHPTADLSESESEWHVHAELPGVEKNDVHVVCDDNILTISGDRKRGADGRKYHKSERAYGAFQRDFTLPVAVDPATIKANFKDGVLEVSVPKPKDYVGFEVI